MGKKDKKIPLTIESQLEYHYAKGKYSERSEILWHAWNQNKRWLSQLLETTMSSFPTYSKHDESHARTVLHNIEMILGKKRIKQLSASDCFMLLHTVYIHDIGMVITHEDREKIVQDNEFLEMVKQMEDVGDPVFQRAIDSLRRQDYFDKEEGDPDEKTKKLYLDKLGVYYAITHLISSYRRAEHGNLSHERLVDWTLASEKLGSGFSMAGIPLRIFMWIARCAGLHTDTDFGHIMELPQEDNGYASDYLHPRFIAVLLQLGDMLDMDNDRFHPLVTKLMGTLPEFSKHHYEKHQAIRRLYIRPNSISIEADCESQEVLRLVKKECDMLRDILKEAGYNWVKICPEEVSGSLPTVESIKLYLKGKQIPEELITTQFKISQNKAFAILEDSYVYKEQFVFLREFLKNAIDASKIQYWQECVKTRGYYKNPSEMRKMSPNELDKVLSIDNFPIEIEMQIAKQNEEKEIKVISEEDVEQLYRGIKTEWQYGVRVRIRDFGTGIDKDCINNIASVGIGRRREKSLIKEMPVWLQPTAEFGIGLQGAFILTNMFKCYSYTRSNEKYEITFSTMKSAYYEGYINVRPLDKFPSQQDDAYGTCFEVFVPAQKKLKHEMYPAAWDGKDYFDDDYAALRPLRHAAELIAQMALYLDKLVGEQFFPIHLKVQELPDIKILSEAEKAPEVSLASKVKIPLNTTEKNMIRKLSFHIEDESNEPEEISDAVREFFDEKSKIVIQNVFQKRKWARQGKSWLFHMDKDTERVVVERTDNAVAMLDCKNGHLYYWDNLLSVYCLANMENFLLRERRNIEKVDGSSENFVPGVRLYYKGIELEEKELPGIGNELFQYIDIKGTLEREYINLSRKGFTESGERYFLQHIYYPLLDTILKTLKIMDTKQGDKIKKEVYYSIKEKEKALEKIKVAIEIFDKENKNLPDREKILQEQLKKKLLDLQKRLMMLYKDYIISITILAFFAQKDKFAPIAQIGLGEKENTATHCWDAIIEYVQESCRVWEEYLGGSVLFHIEHRPFIDLLKDNQSNAKGIIAFPDIFSDKNQFMVVSKREDKSAPWKQYLVPVCKLNEEYMEVNGHSIIFRLRKYSMMDRTSNDMNILEREIEQMGEKALEVAHSLSVDEFGNQKLMTSGEYLQQYLLKWLLKYIPTIALFMNNDGNVRVNIIYSKIFPFVYMNVATKRLIIERIIEKAINYGIQRFSIPAWQGLEHLKCQELPYSHYFVKRGYLSDESYGKVIFPFSEEELLEIVKLAHPEEERERIDRLKHLGEVFHIRRYLTDLIPDSLSAIEELLSDIESQGEQLQSQGKKENLISLYRQFIYDFLSDGRRALRIMDRVRRSYRNLIVNIYDTIEKKQYSLDNLMSADSNWNIVFLWILLNAVYREYMNGQTLLLPEKYGTGLQSLGTAWYFILNNQYLQDSENMVKYKQNYYSQLEKGLGTTFQKRERILDYICMNNRSSLDRDYLTSSWMLFVREVFYIFEFLKQEQYKVLDDLADDRTAIEELIVRKEGENTDDADNE